MSRTIKISNIFAYIQGKLREKLFYSWFKWILALHTIEQIEWRLKVMRPACYLGGSCTRCGCDTPALQMANKACEGKCYPKFKSRKEWKKFKESKEQETWEKDNELIFEMEELTKDLE